MEPAPTPTPAPRRPPAGFAVHERGILRSAREAFPSDSEDAAETARLRKRSRDEHRSHTEAPRAFTRQPSLPSYPTQSRMQSEQAHPAPYDITSNNINQDQYQHQHHSFYTSAPRSASSVTTQMVPIQHHQPQQVPTHSQPQHRRPAQGYPLHNIPSLSHYITSQVHEGIANHPGCRVEDILLHHLSTTWFNNITVDFVRVNPGGREDYTQAFLVLMATTYACSLQLDLPLQNAARQWLCDIEVDLWRRGALGGIRNMEF